VFLLVLLLFPLDLLHCVLASSLPRVTNRFVRRAAVCGVTFFVDGVLIAGGGGGGGGDGGGGAGLDVEGEEVVAVVGRDGISLISLVVSLMVFTCCCGAVSGGVCGSGGGEDGAVLKEWLVEEDGGGVVLTGDGVGPDSIEKPN
jgi:hypothetical protein